MGLSGPKQKQRLVGSASTRNTAWLNDASAPGQRMLAQMGWSTGQSLGLTMPGLTENLKVAYKMDNKGIGAQRHEREARANGKDIWVGGGGDLGNLFERLNAANAASSSSSAVVSAPFSADSSGDEKTSKKSKKEKKEKKEGKDKKDKRDKKDKKEKKEKSTDEKSKKKRKHDDSDDASREKTKKSKKDRSEAKKSKRALEKQKEDVVAAVASADPSLAADKAAVDAIKTDIVQGRPVRMAHRAKFLRAKRMVSANDLASVNEILGIASTPSSSAAGTPKATSGTSTPTTIAPKTYPGPGGSEIPLTDVDRRLETEQDARSQSSSSEEKGNKKKDKKDKKDKKKDKEAKKSKKSASAEKTSAPTASDGQAAAAVAAAAVAEEKEKATQIGTNSQGLFVFEYLNRRLMIRKAQIAKQKKAEQEAIFARAARVGA
ncbi:G-patch domain-containing protein [Pseudozyma hubeiensis]|nr:G-patch domain-containing protein [Pseudozyma hubeiensis]